jgi:toxin ParE1/3/4
MSLRLVISPTANRDIDEAMDWYDEQDADLGNHFIKAIQDRFDFILKYPLISRTMSDSPLRRTLLTGWPYIIYYRISGDTARVIAIIHTARDPKYISARIH